MEYDYSMFYYCGKFKGDKAYTSDAVVDICKGEVIPMHYSMSDIIHGEYCLPRRIRCFVHELPV